MRKKTVTNLMFIAAAILLAGSIAGSTRAALTYYSETYLAHIDMKSIGVTLVENDRDISWRDYTHAGDEWEENTGVLLAYMLTDAGDNSLVLGKNYREQLSVKNSGTIDEYVRVTVYRYWVDEDGNKLTDCSPDLIDLNLLTGEHWLEDVSAATAERNVLYYDRILKSGETSPLFADTIKIDDEVLARVSESSYTDADGYTTITTTYDYNGVKFILEADVDAVQTHNAEDAIMSAWGVSVKIADDGSLSLQ